jgi:signal transduction histidine kinase
MENERQPLAWPVSAVGDFPGSSSGARILATSLGGAFAMGAGAAIGVGLGAPFTAALIGSAGALISAAILVFAAHRWLGTVALVDPSAHKRALDQLSEELTSLASPSDVASAIERTIERLLVCDAIEFSFAPAASAVAGATRKAADDPGKSHPFGCSAAAPTGDHRSGEHQIVSLPRRRSEPPKLAFPVEFHGMQLGLLKVSRATGGQRFSPADAELLRAIAHEGGLALAHAVAYSELEKRRRQQAAAWRNEREALVETLSAEIAHEVRYPINFFRTIFQRASGYHSVLEEEDIEIGCEEVDRLERLVSGLRRMATQQLERRVVDVSELAGRAEVLLRDRMGGHALIIDLEEGSAINCDIDKITQVLVNLLANALEATDGKGGVGVDWRWTPQGGALSVWDTGPGFSGDPSRLFAPWYTTKPRGTGLGLAISYRLVRAHGWSIEAMRRDSKTVFVVAVPASDIVVETGRASAGLPRGKKGEVA